MTSLAEHPQVPAPSPAPAGNRRRFAAAAMSFIALLGVLVGLMLALG